MVSMARRLHHLRFQLLCRGQDLAFHEQFQSVFVVDNIVICFQRNAAHDNFVVKEYPRFVKAEVTKPQEKVLRKRHI